MKALDTKYICQNSTLTNTKFLLVTLNISFQLAIKMMNFGPKRSKVATKYPDGTGVKKTDVQVEQIVIRLSQSLGMGDAYCKYKGGYLPTESQWECCLSKGNDISQSAQKFPWGNNDNIEAIWYSGGKYGHLQSVLTKPVRSTTKSSYT